jgi:hypothetical protein
LISIDLNFRIAHRITWKYQPGSPFILYFTNPIDVSTCEKSLFTWDKTPGTVTYIPQESQIIINNQSKANSKYTLTVNRKLKDVYGQSLEGDNTVTFTTDAGFGSLSMFLIPIISLCLFICFVQIGKLITINGNIDVSSSMKVY